MSAEPVTKASARPDAVIVSERASSAAAPGLELLQSIVANAPTALAVLAGRELRYTFVNAAYQAIVPGVDMVGRRYLEVFPDGAGREAEARFRRVLETGEPWLVDHYRASTPGKPDAAWQGEVIRLPARPGEPPSALIAISDVTDRVRAEDALRDSQARYQTLFETMSEGFSINEIICDENGHPCDLRYLEVNPGFERHTGLKAADLVGRTLRELFPDAERSWFERYGKVALTGEPAHFEAAFGPLGRWFEVSVYRTEPRRFAVVFFDVTERRKAVAALREADRRKDEFLSAASHELRTPLATLRLQTQTLARALAREELDEARARSKLAAIEGQLDRLDALVNTLLDVSRIAADRLQLDREKLDLAQLAAEAIERFEEAAERSETELVLRAHPVVGRWDRVRLDQVITNLLQNALKFAPGKPIEIEVAERDGQAVLAVRDHGPGISPESRTRIFERFERAAEARSFGGLGLGLWISRQIVEAHGGSIVADGEPGAGSVFTVVLPLKAP